MSFSRDEPNPLRPYASRPVFEPTPIDTSARPAGPHGRPNASQPISNARVGHGPSKRDILSDIDYGDYLPDASPSLTELLKSLVDQGLWKYTSVLFAQPFEVAKVVLQVQDANAVGSSTKTKEKSKARRRSGYRRSSAHPISSDDSDDDSQSYFTSSAPLPSAARSQRRRHASPPTSPRSPASSVHGDHSSAIHIQNLSSASSVTAALSTLWTHEGVWGVWKGTNSTFIHGILHSTITSFLRSLIFALLGLPDPGVSSTAAAGPAAFAAVDIAATSSPFLSLVAAVTASGVAGLILAPVDMARTKIILTPSTHGPRSIIPTLRSFKSWIVPASIAPVTILHSILPTFVATSTPIFLRSNMGIDPVLTPTAYRTATFMSQAVELSLRLPVETALRRGQIAAVKQDFATPSPIARRSSQQVSLTTVVDAGEYKGITGTLYHIMFEEGSRDEVKPSAAHLPARKRKGQGLPGLFRGWRVGVWGLVGFWGATTFGGSKMDEF